MKLLENTDGGLEGVSSSATGSWQSPGGGSGGKAQKNFDLWGVILETEGSVLQRCKRALFPTKIYKRAPQIWANPLFIVYLDCFWYNKFLKK